MTSHIKIVASFLTVAAILFAIFFLLDAGGDIERAKNVKENADATNNANERATSLRDCHIDGRVYEYETGNCRRPGRSYWKLPSWLAR